MALRPPKHRKIIGTPRSGPPDDPVLELFAAVAVTVRPRRSPVGPFAKGRLLLEPVGHDGTGGACPAARGNGDWASGPRWRNPEAAPTAGSALVLV